MSDLNDLIVLKQTKTAELSRLLETGQAETRELTTDETNTFEALQGEVRDIETQINAKNITQVINFKQENRMTKFNELIVRNGANIENFSTRAVVLASGIDNVTVAGDISSVGYEPFYKQMGVSILPNLTGSIKLPFIGNVIAGKVGEGVASANDKAISTVLLQPVRYTITETVGDELAAVGNEAALQSFIFEMVKGCDKAITKDIFDVLITGAGVQAGLAGGYTSANLDTLVAGVDGDVTLLMPRAEFYKAKAVKVDIGSGLFVANKGSQFAGQLWDGTPLFYSQLFANATVVAADLKHITVGEFGDEYKISFLPIPSKGQVEITVVKMAGVVLRNASAAKKALITA